jgi:hypothetical protein
MVCPSATDAARVLLTKHAPLKNRTLIIEERRLRVLSFFEKR